MQLCYVQIDAYREADNLPKWDRLEAYAALNRMNALYMIQRAGSGHIGSSFSSMDIITYMHLEHPEIAFFSSKGHDAPAFYASMIAQGKLPFEMLHKLRRVGGLPGHPELKTPRIVAHSGSLGMGISKAKGLIRANRLKGIQQRVAVLLGDGELQEGQVWESLMDADFQELLVVIDFNGLATEGKPHLPGIGKKLSQFGTAYMQDGHSFMCLANLIKQGPALEDPPHIRIAHTTKGKGILFLEGKPESHSGALGKDQYQTAVVELQNAIEDHLPQCPFGYVESPAPRLSTPGLIDAYAEALVLAGLTNQQVVVLDADLSTDCGLTFFRANYPDRFIECGIAEQDMVSQAGMLAAQGFVPICHSFAAFLTRRANEQIYDNCHQNLKVIYVGTLAGRLPDGPGPSHEALEDVALMRTMPNMEILEPRDTNDVVLAVHYAVNQAEGPVYLRIAANPIERVRIN